MFKKAKARNRYLILGDDVPVPIQLIILKHRNGPTKNIDLLFRKKTSTFLSIKMDGDNGGK